jgi:starch-binding outer membrane protein, SusD/RagB family
MKSYKSIIGISFFLLAFQFCKKTLDQPAIGLVDESKLANKKGVEGLLIGAYSLLDGVSYDFYATNSWEASGSNWIYGSICGSEAYKGSIETDQAERISTLETFTTTSGNVALATKWKIVYAGVQRANDVLRIMKMVKDINTSDRQRIAAEARFLRGFYHFEAIKMWNKVPYVDETITYNNGNYHLPNDTLIWGAIENDFKFAMENLPIKMDAAGRANKYAAESFLAKAYLFQGRTNAAKYAAAKILLDDLINNGSTANGIKYALLQSYHDNFNPETKNSSESVFAAQTSVKDGPDDDSQGFNGNLGDLLNFPFNDAGTGVPGGCCGFFAPSQYLVNHFKTDSQTGLPDPDHFNEVAVKNDEFYLHSDPFIPHEGPLDPRLDWTVGRRGIPFLDWGEHPGSDEGFWIRERTNSGPYTAMKNTYSKSQADHFVDDAFWSQGSVATNINLIRFADVLLWAAEVEIEIGSLDKARVYINMVRSRAADPGGWVKRADGSPAANYKIGLYESSWTDRNEARKAVRFERMLELAMEGHRFFDLVRWGIADTEINAYFLKEKTLRSYFNTYHAFFNKGINEYFPIPQTQIDLSAGSDGIQKMKQNPGY